jgi:hypothetical protein
LRGFKRLFFSAILPSQDFTQSSFSCLHTTIQAHTHRDDRMATVVSGMWYFGYGDHFDARSLKRLPPGSVYSEPAAHTHFARTEKEPAIVHIAGYGPTDTRYFDPGE